MCKKRRCSTDGIRFLDEHPTPEPGASPAPAATPKPPARKRREWPVGVMTFLAVVGIGSMIKRGGEPASVEVRAVIEDRFDVDAAPRIEVETFDGAVRVNRGVSDSVSYRLETSAKGLDDEDARRALRLIRPTIEGDRGALRIRVDHGSVPRGWSGRAEVHLEVPADAMVRVVTRNGSVRVEDIHGSIAAKSTNGRIQVEDASGPIVLQTSNGSIECEASDALVSAETSNGAISFRGSLAPGTSRMVTSNGSVSLRLPEDDRFLIDASSRNGRVTSDFPIERSGETQTLLVSGERDSAARRIEVRTTNGAIRIEKD